jgi:hypothetical protein
MKSAAISAMCAVLLAVTLGVAPAFCIPACAASPAPTHDCCPPTECACAISPQPMSHAPAKVEATAPELTKLAAVAPIFVQIFDDTVTISHDEIALPFEKRAPHVALFLLHSSPLI